MGSFQWGSYLHVILDQFRRTLNRIRLLPGRCCTLSYVAVDKYLERLLLLLTKYSFYFSDYVQAYLTSTLVIFSYSRTCDMLHL